MEIKNVYMGYTYRGTLKIKHGHIEIDRSLPFPTCQFFDEDQNRHTKQPFRPYCLYYGHVWGQDRDKVKAIIVNRYRERIRELESSPALAYAEAIAGD